MAVARVLRAETWQVIPRHVYGRNNTVYRHPAVFLPEDPKCGLGSTDYTLSGGPIKLNFKEEETPNACWVVIN